MLRPERSRPRPRELVREGARQALSRRRLAFARALIVLAAGVAAGFVATTAHQRAAQAVARQISLGRNTTRFVGHAGGGITAASCDAAGAVSGVRAAGGFVLRGGARLATGARVQVTIATPGFVHLLTADAHTRPGRLLIGRSVAERTGIRSGSPVALDGGAVHLAQLLPATPRSVAWANTVVVPQAPAGVIDECWVEMPVPSPSVLAMVDAVLDGPRPLSSGPVDRDAIRLTPEEVQATAFTPWRAGATVGLVSLLVTVMSWWALREGWTLYLAVGFDGAAVGFLAGVDGVLLSLAPAVSGLAWGTLAASLGHIDPAVPIVSTIVAGTGTALAIAWLRLFITRLSLRRSLAGL